MNSKIANPKHYYLAPGIEVINIREILLRKIEEKQNCGLSLQQIDCWSRSLEYLLRFMDKNGIEDLQKAYQYLHRLLYNEWPKQK